MSSQNKKEDFINYLLEQKHGAPRESNPLEYLKKEVEIETLDITKEELTSLFTSLDLKVSSWDCKKQDLLFCFLYLNPRALKVLKDKEDGHKFPEMVAWYKKAFDENKKFLKDFNSKKEEVEKSVVTRFPPEPSGYLHIGHAKAALVNVNIAEKGKGRMILRFDDTNPEKRYEEFEDQIIRDLKDLKIEKYSVSHSSDYFPLIIEKARFLISEGKAYCDNTSQEDMKKERMDGIESKNREVEPLKNLEIFERMLKGEAEGFCLRAKIDMKDNNKAMRDPVIFRSTKAKHYRVGDSLHAFPTYDFTCPILDSIEGVTVACRSNEYRDRNSQYNWFLENLKLENKPTIFDFSRLNFENTVLSKRKISELIQRGCVKGWDDPRLSTIQGIKRAGMDMSVLREYILLQGASQKTNTISWDKVWAMNKKAIDGYSPRFMAVPVEDVVHVSMKGVNLHLKSHPLHKKSPLGFKSQVYDRILLISQEDALLLQEKEEFTLMNWGNAIVIKKEIETGKVKRIEVELHLEGDYKKTKNKISWVSKVGSVVIRTYEIGNLFIENEVFNEESLKEVYYYVESGILKMEIGRHVQFERIGFFYCDGPFEYNLVPFTKQKRMRRE